MKAIGGGQDNTAAVSGHLRDVCLDIQVATQHGHTSTATITKCD